MKCNNGFDKKTYHHQDMIMIRNGDSAAADICISNIDGNGVITVNNKNKRC